MKMAAYYKESFIEQYAEELIAEGTHPDDAYRISFNYYLDR